MTARCANSLGLLPIRRVWAWGLLLVVASVMNVRGSDDDPAPLNNITREIAEGAVVTGIETFSKEGVMLRTFKAFANQNATMAEASELATPIGAAVAVYKLSDFALDVGAAATEREDRTQGAEMILVNADAALLRGLQAQGRDLNQDPTAVAAKQRLADLAEQLKAGDGSNVQHLGNVVWNNLGYSLVKATSSQCLKSAFKMFMESDTVGGWLKNAFPVGDETASLLGNRSELKPFLAYVGWKKFAMRAALAQTFVDKLMEKLEEEAALKLVDQILSGIDAKVLDQLYSEVMNDHPSKLVERERIRALPVASPQIFAAVAAAAVVPAAAAAAEAPPDPPQPADSVARTIQTEDYFVRASRGTLASPPSPPPAPSEPQETPAWLIQYHQESATVGDGKTFLIQSQSGSTWDGRRDGSDNVSP